MANLGRRKSPHFPAGTGLAASLVGRLVDPFGQPRERQALDPDAAGAFQRRQQQPFAAEQHAAQPTSKLDVVVDALGERDQAAGIQAQGFVVQLLADHRSTRVYEGQPIAIQTLQDEALAAEEARADALAEAHADPRAESGAEE